MTNLNMFYEEKSRNNNLDPIMEMLENEHTANEVKEIIDINVAGQLFQTYRTTLERYPDTLLGDPKKRQHYKNPKTKELFFDRHRESFQCILYYYQSGGVMEKSPGIPIDIFVNELIFYELDSKLIEKMQLENGLKEIDTKENLPLFKPFRILWEFFEYPESSKVAKVFAIASLFVIVYSLILFVIETLPSFQPHVVIISDNSTMTIPSVNAVWIKYSNTAVIVWFTIEFLMRLISCPNKLMFFINGGNIIDFLSILPFYLSLIISSNRTETSILRVMRVFRVFKLARHSRGLQILGNTLKASFNELMMLVFFLCVMILFFGSLIYYAEKDVPGTTFISIPDSFWWCIVTMATVGYGDMVPITLWGKLIGSVTIIFGLLLVALPVPIIVSNFEFFYKKDQNRKKVEKEKITKEKEKNRYFKTYYRFLLNRDFTKNIKKAHIRRYSMSQNPDGLSTKLDESPNLNENCLSRNNISYAEEK
ncbi:potassium voltage-gated channel subfamily A member 2 [Hydra vulgaris]|uniref:Potassium voltage-gated channel subfamily A member 2 n=1 Tax=Hydra vulgaris TaxID=6087 RepID=A0ABM4BEC9_HYDVU